MARTQQRLVRLLIAWLWTALAAAASAQDDMERGGTLQAVVGGHTVHLPLLQSHIDADVQGDIATVSVRQVFQNPTAQPLNATYLFPLNKDAAVFAMTMEVGDERVVAQIQKKEEARQTFETARTQGRAAALLTQYRANMFTQDVANLMPGLPITVTLEYVQSVPRIDGAYEFTAPLIVGPRFNPPAEAVDAPRIAVADYASLEPDVTDQATSPASAAIGSWNISPPPEYPDVFGLTVPDSIDADRISITVNLRAAMPIGAVTSATHTLAIEGGDQVKSISLAEGRTIDNRDFTLRYALAGDGVQAGVLTHEDDSGAFVSLLIEPPENVDNTEIAAREVVFVLDTSGSMSGAPMAASKTFMREALKTLRSQDYFRIIQFDSSPREFSQAPVPATPANLRAARRYVNQMRGGGGTMVAPAMRQAFHTRQQPGTLRIVVFLSDGYVGNEAEIFHLITDHIEDARLYAFGVGAAPNRYLMSEMARHGRGFARYVDPTEKGSEAAEDLARRIASPLLTNISIDWGQAGARDVTPARIPDLFDGGSVRIMARLDKLDDHVVTVRGEVNGRAAAMPLRVTAKAHVDQMEVGAVASAAIPLIWARSQIADAMRDYQASAHTRLSGLDDASLKDRVTGLGLEFSLITQWTSFVAVSEAIVNDRPADAIDSRVPLPMVAGVSEAAYPRAATAPQFGSGGMQAGHTFAGSSTPEPGVWVLLLIMAAIGGMLALPRHRKAA